MQPLLLILLLYGRVGVESEQILLAWAFGGEILLGFLLYFICNTN